MINKCTLPLVLLVALGLFSQCSGSRRTGIEANDLEQLVTYMVGDFSSNLQSQQDSDYFDIRLHIRPIWKSDKANHWLYVEQSVASAEDKPYRQRVYKVETDGDKGFKSIIYTLPEAMNWAGKYKNPEAFDVLKPSDLSLREGCTVFLSKQLDGSFAGATQGEGCESTLRGAKYATSTALVKPALLRSWDQGFDENGQQVWGATKGGYEFLKTK